VTGAERDRESGAEGGECRSSLRLAVVGEEASHVKVAEELRRRDRDEEHDDLDLLVREAATEHPVDEFCTALTCVIAFWTRFSEIVHTNR